jgi:hypothetical protein
LKYAAILFLSGIATVVIFIGYTVLAFLFLIAADNQWL